MFEKVFWEMISFIVVIILTLIGYTLYFIELLGVKINWNKFLNIELNIQKPIQINIMKANLKLPIKIKKANKRRV